MFVTTAEEVRDLLKHDKSPEAVSMRREAEALAELFKSWPGSKPGSEERVRAIAQLMDLTNRAMAWSRRKSMPPKNG